MADNSDVATRQEERSSMLQIPTASNSRRRPSPSPDRAIAVAGTSRTNVENKDDEDNTGSDSSEDEHYSSPPGLKRTGTMSKSYSDEEERIVLRKLDRHLTLFLCLLYLLSFLDRSNIGNARIAGLQTSLGITDAQFDLTLVAFYITYITFEWMILLYRLVPPHVYIASCVFAWGLVACLQGSVRSFSQLLTLRALLGITEAAFGPGVPFYMTFFYRREELAYRVGLQISAAPLATSFASSLAWVIVKLSEHSPLESWRALFLFEGFPSIIAAVFAYYIIPDSPSQARWLTPRERKVASTRLHSNVKDTTTTMTSSSRLNRHDLLTTLVDLKAWLPALMFLSVNVSFASLPVFLPTIINSMSFSPVTSQILAAPPYLIAFVFVLLISRASDRRRDSRGLFLIACAGLSSISYAVIATTSAFTRAGVLGARVSVPVRYVAVHGAAAGLFASVVLVITWQLNNQASVSGKGVAMVVLNVVGQTGPLIGVELFPAVDGPFYVKGMAVCAGFMGVVVLLAAVLRLKLAALNRRVEEKFEYEMVGLDGRGGAVDGGEGEGLIGHGGSSRGEQQVFRYML